MLADIYLSQAAKRRGEMDLHSHATFSCTIGKIARRLRLLFNR